MCMRMRVCTTAHVYRMMQSEGMLINIKKTAADSFLAWVPLRTHGDPKHASYIVVTPKRATPNLDVLEPKVRALTHANNQTVASLPI